MKIYLLSTLLLTMPAWSAVPISPVTDQPGAKKLATIENENLKLSFVAATRGGQASARPLVQVHTAAGWVDAPVDAAAESYQVLSAPETVAMEIPIRGFYPRWPDAAKGKSQGPRIIWDAGKNYEATRLTFKAGGIKADGTSFQSSPASIGVSP